MSEDYSIWRPGARVRCDINGSVKRGFIAEVTPQHGGFRVKLEGECWDWAIVPYKDVFFEGFYSADYYASWEVGDIVKLRSNPDVEGVITKLVPQHGGVVVQTEDCWGGLGYEELYWVRSTPYVRSTRFEKVLSL